MLHWGTGRLVVLCAGVALLSSGCVTKGKFEDVERRLGNRHAENEVLQSANQELTAELARVRADRASLKKNLSVAETKINSLEGTYGSLVNELRSEVASGQIKIRQVAEGIRVDLTQQILFPSGGWDLDESGRQVIERVAAQIGEQPSEILVEGHTDNVKLSAGLQRRFPTNWELAAARAASVVRILADSGVDPTRLRVVSRGPFAPIESNDTADGRASNRRIEILLRPPVK